MKYSEWLKVWLEDYVKNSVKARTYARYRDIAYQHLIPKLGEMEIEQLKPVIVQKYIADLMHHGNLKTGGGLSSNSVNSMITVIQNSTRTAFLVGIAQEYLLNRLKRPKTVGKEVQCFSMEEQKRIEKAVMEDSRDRMKGVILCLYTGLRIGELLALEWKDIDFSKMELTVSKTCYDGKNENGTYCRFLGTPKTPTSRRVIPIPKQIMPLLQEMRKKQHSEYVVSNGEKVISVRSYQNSFSALLKKNHIPHKGIHSLRHTFATRALECGMDVKTLSEILGHKSPTVTLNRYAHSMTEHKKQQMSRLGSLFSAFTECDNRCTTVKFAPKK